MHMNRVYEYGPVTVRVRADPGGRTYVASLEALGTVSSPVEIDAHWGADHASKFALETYLHAFSDPDGFVAQERLEASQSGPRERQGVEQWALQVVKEADNFGDALEEAIKAAELQQPEDITGSIETYLGLLEFAWQAEIESLLSEGYSNEDAKAEIYRRGLERFKKRWIYVPRMRPPRGMVM